MLRSMLKIHRGTFALNKIFKNVCQMQVMQFRQMKKDLADKSNCHQTSIDAENIEQDADLEVFPSDIRSERDQSRLARRPKIDPRKTSIILFPGQGSHFLGMGKQVLDYPNVQYIYEVASDILGYDLLDMCLNGPIETLSKTVHSQPAIFVTSLAAIEKLKETNPAAISNCIATAGFSVGEYAALTFSGAMSFEDALHVVKVRAEAMQKASEEIDSGMMTVFEGPGTRIGKVCEIARDYCSHELNIDKAECVVANYLFPECKVVAGNIEALEFIATNAKEFDIRKVKYLPVSGGFHTPLMQSAVDTVRKELRNIEIAEPRISVHSNVDAARFAKRNLVKKLSKQLTCSVKWEQTLHTLYSRKLGENFPDTFEVGPGKQLGFMLSKTNKKCMPFYTHVDV